LKRLDPPYRLVLTGTPMENRLDELASIVEWVDDLALEPKWRLAAWHTTPVDGRTEIGGARNLDTLRARHSRAGHASPSARAGASGATG
jgi:SNF2 family DNA or RNA helicase